MTELHQDICSATWWDSKLFNALIHPKLWLETPRWLSHAAPTTTRSIHQPNGLYIFNPCHLSGWGSVMRERGGSNSLLPASAQQGNRWFMVSRPFRITLFLCCLFPSLPAVVCLLSLFPSSIPIYSIKIPSFFHLTPRGCFLHPILHRYSLSNTSHSSFSIFNFPPASSLLFTPSHRICLFASFLTQFYSSISSLYLRTLGTMAPCTSLRWQPSTWETTVAMPTAMKTSIRHMCSRWMVSSSSFLTYSGDVDKILGKKMMAFSVWISSGSCLAGLTSIW